MDRNELWKQFNESLWLGKKKDEDIMRFCSAVGKGYDISGKEANKHNGDKMPG